ncbi:MAG: peptide-methionine (R)-S-oxide reductase MsrB [Polaribacter sp.]|nr:peptide-methionine (R)-S-oxide reductase MsrB [Polaribacter sp.]
MKQLKKTILIKLIFLCVFGATGQRKKINPIIKTDMQWKLELTALQFYVLRKSGTETAFSSALNNNYAAGTYVCAACKTPLYTSEHKYDSGSGWPAFDSAIEGSVSLDVDYKIGVARTELKCATCGGHLGHSFNDGPKETTGKRHCINGAALLFIPKKK